jgi:hypothetical protein
MRFHDLAIPNVRDRACRQAPRPVTTRGGFNVTPPPMVASEAILSEVKTHYQQILSAALKCARELYARGLVFEFAFRPPLDLGHRHCLGSQGSLEREHVPPRSLSHRTTTYAASPRARAEASERVATR